MGQLAGHTGGGVHPLMDALFIFLQKAIPQHLISRIAGKLAESRVSWWKNFFISWFVRKYKVDMSEAENPSATSYPNFNTFFTRALLPDARSICAGEHSLACPADGAISQIGDIADRQILQAKGHDYSLESLLAGDKVLAQKFVNGKFATIYLSPKDYHRVHMPLTGVLQEMLHVPGELFSVNTVTANHVPGLFARNERMIALFDTAVGPVAVIMVGAMIVASIETVWAGLLPGGRKEVTHTSYTKRDKIQLDKGHELGRFKLGSTVILLFPENTLSLQAGLQAESPVRMGQCMGQLSPGSHS